MTDIVLNTKTYSGLGINAGVSRYVERSGGVASSFSNLDQSITADGKILRHVTKLKFPVVATAASACSCEGEVLRTTDAILTIRVPQMATAAERKDFGLRLKDLISSPAFQASIENLVQMPG